MYRHEKSGGKLSAVKLKINNFFAAKNAALKSKIDNLFAALKKNIFRDKKKRNECKKNRPHFFVAENIFVKRGKNGSDF